jgi:hypothetical protein
MPEARLIGNLHIDAREFSNVVGQFIGRDIYSKVNESARNLSDNAALLAALMNFKGHEGSAITCIRDSASVQPMVQYLFIVGCSVDACHLLNNLGTGLAFAYEEQRGHVLMFISGTLKQWHDGVLEGMRSSDKELQILFDKIFLEFEKAGVGEIWHGLTRTTRPDRTFYLE